MKSGMSRSLVRRGSLATVFAVAVVLLVTPLSVAMIVCPWQFQLPAGVEVAESDASGVNVLEPTIKTSGSVVSGKTVTVDGAERAVGEWNPTGGGKGGKGSPKK